MLLRISLVTISDILNASWTDLSNVTFSAPSWLIFQFSVGCLNYGLWSNKVKFVYISHRRRLTLRLFIEVYKSSEQAARIIERDGQNGEALSRAEVQRASAYLL